MNASKVVDRHLLDKAETAIMSKVYMKATAIKEIARLVAKGVAAGKSLQQIQQEADEDGSLDVAVAAAYKALK